MWKSDKRIKFEKNLRTILDLYWNENKNLKEISGIIEISEPTLRYYCRKMKLLRHVGHNSRRYKCDENFFEKIDNEKKAYWLGVLYADGCVTHIKNSKYIVLSAKDEEWINKFKEDLSFTGPVLVEQHKKYHKDIYKAKICSKKMYSDLIDKGVVERKSLILQFPSTDIVPEDLMPHFIRGYFDGDGSVGLYENMKGQNWKRLHISFSCGNVDFLNSLKTWLIEHDIYPISRPVSRKGSYLCALNISLIAGIKLREYMYKDATVYLQRKHDIFFSVRECKRTFNDYNRVSQDGIKE